MGEAYAQKMLQTPLEQICSHLSHHVLPSFMFRRDVLDILHHAPPPVLDRFISFLDGDVSRSFFEELSGAALLRPNISATLFRNGHFLTPHSDEINQRALAFILHLTKAPCEGGELVWCRP